MVRINSKQDVGHIGLQGEEELNDYRGERERGEGRRGEGERETEGETYIYLILSIADSEIVQESGFIQKHQPTCRMSGFNFTVLSINTTCPHKNTYNHVHNTYHYCIKSNIFICNVILNMKASPNSNDGYKLN